MPKLVNRLHPEPRRDNRRAHQNSLMHSSNRRSVSSQVWISQVGWVEARDPPIANRILSMVCLASSTHPTTSPPLQRVGIGLVFCSLLLFTARSARRLASRWQCHL